MSILFFLGGSGFFIKTIRAMLATALATVPAFEVVLLSEHNIPLLGVVVVTLFSGYIAVGFHVGKIMV